ncbi:MAG TPA: heme-binding protein [Beijerinckiaceae bacterium]|jgi:uncharacterized protein GlcG (DUF336 family)
MGRTGSRAGVFASAVCGVLLVGLATPARAADCPVDHDRLAKALKASVKPAGGPKNGGFENHQWAGVVSRDGTVCAVAFSGDKADDQWPGSRAVAMEKASTANAFSVSKMALSTANLFAQAQPGQSLYGILQASPPSPEALAGDAAQFGTPSDPMLGKRIGGVVVFGGGLALYDDGGVVGGLGVSGDSSCADHNVAWRVRTALGLDKVPAGVSPGRKDAIVYDLGPDGKSASGFGHVKCAGDEADVANELAAGVGGQSLK